MAAACRPHDAAGLRCGHGPRKSRAASAPGRTGQPEASSTRQARRITHPSRGRHLPAMRHSLALPGLLAALAVDGHGAAIVPATAVPPFSAGRCGVVRVPELPPRVVALANLRRPPPNAPTRALFDVLRDVVAATRQPGVRLGSDAFPLGRALS